MKKTKHQKTSKYQSGFLCLGITVAVFSNASLSLAGGNGSSPKGKPFIAINDQIVEVHGAVTSLQDQIDGLVADVDTVEDRVGATEDAIAGLEAIDTYLKGLIAINATDIATINGEIAALQAESVDLQAQITANDGDIATHQAQIDLNATVISTLQASMLSVQNSLVSLDTNLQGQIDGHADLISALQDEIVQINESLAMKQMIVSGSCPVGQSIREIMPDGSVACEVEGGASNITQVRVYNVTLVGQNLSSSVFATCPVGFALTGGSSRSAESSRYRKWDLPARVSGSVDDSNITSNRTWHAYLSRPNYSTLLFSYAVCIKFN